jgi:hypothetical protein
MKGRFLKVRMFVFKRERVDIASEIFELMTASLVGIVRLFFHVPHFTLIHPSFLFRSAKKHIDFIGTTLLLNIGHGKQQ